MYTKLRVLYKKLVGMGSQFDQKSCRKIGRKAKISSPTPPTLAKSHRSGVSIKKCHLGLFIFSPIPARMQKISHFSRAIFEIAYETELFYRYKYISSGRAPTPP